MVSWQTLQSLLFLFGPFLVPKILATIRSIRNAPRSQIQPLPPAASRGLALLFLSGLFFFATTLPLFHPENIFRITHSRLQTPGGVLLTRLAALRPITPSDEAFRAFLDAYPTSLEPRLLYARYGPATLLDNPLASPIDRDAARSFLLYALPANLLPHVFHLVILGLATSTFIAGPTAGYWRSSAAFLGLALAAAEIFLLTTYDDAHNRRVTRATDTDFLYWKLLTYRGLALAAADALLGWAMWAQATGRLAFFSGAAAAAKAEERLQAHATALEALLSKARGIGVLRNAMVRAPGARRSVEAYWRREAEVMRDALEQPEVLAAQRNALRRMDVVRVQREAEGFVDGALAPLAETMGR